MQTISVNYPASRVITLVHAPNLYFSGVAAGVAQALKYLRTAEKVKGCADQAIVLAGYSQGAMVMHRLLHLLDAYPSILHRVAAVVLVADGDAVPKDNVTHFGSAAASTDGVAQALRTVSKAKTTPFTSAQKRMVLSVCDKGDLVGDFSQTFGLGPTTVLTSISTVALFAGAVAKVATGVSIHLHYAGKPESVWSPVPTIPERTSAQVRRHV
jgi:hypothetical protein